MKIINKKNQVITSNQIPLRFVLAHFCCNMGLVGVQVPALSPYTALAHRSHPSIWEAAGVN